MKALGQLWQEAGRVVARAAREVDAAVNGTARAQRAVAEMNEPARAALREVVVGEMGQRAWDDFEQAVGSRQ